MEEQVVGHKTFRNEDGTFRHELFDGSDAQELDGGWVSFSVAQPEGCEIVQQYLGEAVLEHSNPPDWAFPTERWRGKKDSAATHWRYVDAPNA